MDYRDLGPLVECKDGTEAEMLCFALDRVRKQFAWKTGELNAEQLRVQVSPSTITLAGLVKHMAFVEDGFTTGAHDRPLGPPWDKRDWVGNDRWGWESAVDDDPDALYALWYGAVARSRTAWNEMIADGGLDVTLDRGEDWVISRRRILIDLLEEYLKHTGHADILREAVDGRVGNDPPAAGMPTSN